MAIRSLNSLRRVRAALVALRNRWMALRHGVAIHPGATVSLSARLLPGQRGAIAIGEGTLVAFKTLLIARHPDGRIDPIIVGRNCFIGGGATVLPGVTIGDGSIVGAGAVVAIDVPPGCAVGGNPARVLRTDIRVGRFGRLDYADENSRKMWR